MRTVKTGLSFPPQKKGYMQFETSIATKIDEESDYVRNGDVILIVTANHAYQFTVSDSHARRGSLTGGALGEKDFHATSRSLIHEGYGARFDVGAPGPPSRMETSEVRELVCIREGEKAGLEIIKFPPSTSGEETSGRCHAR